MNDPIVMLSDVSKIFRTENIETSAVNDISFNISTGEYIAISGPSGCGKSTLLSIMGLLDKPTNGEYLLNGVSIHNLSDNQLADLRNRQIGFIFQSFNLLESLTVEENVQLPLIYRSDLSQSEIDRRVNDVLGKVDMLHRRKHIPTSLSGGQQQRVAVARAMVTQPSIILADEPTGNLDSKSADIVMNLLKNEHAKGATICIVTHDPRYTRDATRTINFLDGSIVKTPVKQPELAVIA